MFFIVLTDGKKFLAEPYSFSTTLALSLDKSPFKWTLQPADEAETAILLAYPRLEKNRLSKKKFVEDNGRYIPLKEEFNLDNIIKEAINEAIKESNGVKKFAAQRLGITVRQLGTFLENFEEIGKRCKRKIRKKKGEKP